MLFLFNLTNFYILPWIITYLISINSGTSCASLFRLATTYGYVKNYALLPRPEIIDFTRSVRNKEVFYLYSNWMRIIRCKENNCWICFIGDSYFSFASFITVDLFWASVFFCTSRKVSIDIPYFLDISCNFEISVSDFLGLLFSRFWAFSSAYWTNVFLTPAIYKNLSTD